MDQLNKPNKRTRSNFNPLKDWTPLVTNKHLMDKTDPEPYIICRTEISIKHILLDCRQFNEERVKYNIPNSIMP
jgi:hypothetical protein